MKREILDSILHRQHRNLPGGGLSQDSVKKIAVLFTDIVGSTKYFKAHGDQAGRQMLSHYYTVATDIIHEYKGSVIKNLGDIVMAYFLNPKDALKAAIRIQQKYFVDNQDKSASAQIKIKICLHYGYGIFEDDDIYGDAVNGAVKLTTFTDERQIIISQEVYDAVSDLELLKFELIDISKKENVPEDLIAYRTIWDEAVIYDPVVTTIMCVKPLWESAGDYFKEAWQKVFDQKNYPWRNQIEKEATLSDRTVFFVMKDDSSILDTAQSIMAYLQDSSGEDKTSMPLPVQIVIDSGSYMRADKIVLQDFHVPWEDIAAGNIYLSTAAYNTLKNLNSFLPAFIGESNQSGSFFKLNVKLNGEEKTVAPFLYHDALIQGENSPCLYCGSRKHFIADCPSKHLPEITNSINKIGYKSINEINKIYFDYVTKFKPDQEKQKDPEEGNALIAHQTFYDLKRIFQIRFFRTIWDTEEKLWNNIKSRMCDANRSGSTWIAQDCIRVSNHTKAETLLKNSLITDQHDYKIYCALAFVNIEENKFSLAESYIDKALECAKTAPAQIFLLFLLFRIYELNNNVAKASRMIREITARDPLCTDAVYLDIVMQFRRGGTSDPLRKLIKLIQNNREYYIHTLLDPDLKPYMGVISNELKNILNNARNEAKLLLPRAEEELRKIRVMFGNEENAVQRTTESLLNINKLIETDSYFGYLDAIYYAGSISNIVHRTIEERKKALYRDMMKLSNRLDNYEKFASMYPDKKMIRPFYEKLDAFQNMLKENWRKIESCTPKEFMDAVKKQELFCQEIEEIEKQFKKLATIQWMRQFFKKTMKRNIIFITGTLVVAFILLPIAVFYANVALISMKISPIYEIWFYQKMISIIGSLCSIILSFFITMIDVPKKDFLMQ
ncbi:MAG: adenylate/guanylate cyclase domain-containing protein [Syntrophaceae bacterium]